MTTVVEVVDTKAIEVRQADIVERMTAIIVDSNESLVACEALVTRADAEIKEVDAEFNPGIKGASDLHKRLLAQRKKYREPLERIKSLGNGKGRTYRRQLEDERHAKEAELRAAELKAAEERKLAEAVERAEAGHTEAADVVMEQPAAPAPVVVQSAAPPPPPRRYVEKWTARVDKPDDVPRPWCDPAQVRLNEYARRLKQAAVGTVPGVTFYDAQGL